MQHPTTDTRSRAARNWLRDARQASSARARCESAQATVEFALLLPVAIVILFGIVLFGFALNDWIDETQLSSQAARFAAVDSNHGEGTLDTEVAQTTFLNWVKEQADNKELEKHATAEMCSPTSKVGDYVKVALTYDYNWFGLGGSKGAFGLFGTEALKAETPITSTATMRIEREPAKAYPTHLVNGKC